MADLFVKQAKKYVETRPTYPSELFEFIASKCPHRHLAWDVGTGNGQAAVPLAGIFDRVIATDTSRPQLSHATRLPNIEYHHTPASSFNPTSLFEPQSLDLVICAQAIHWFDRPIFYSQLNELLRRPNGVIAAWCYTIPRVDPTIDSLLDRFFNSSLPYWAPQRRYVDEQLRTIEFPFEPVEGEKDTGPFEFMAEREVNLDGYLGYLRSWSAYVTAKDSGVELLGVKVVDDFEKAWGGVGMVKIMRFPIFLRLGRVVIEMKTLV